MSTSFSARRKKPCCVVMSGAQYCASRDVDHLDNKINLSGKLRDANMKKNVEYRTVRYDKKRDSGGGNTGK